MSPSSLSVAKWCHIHKTSYTIATCPECTALRYDADFIEVVRDIKALTEHPDFRYEPVGQIVSYIFRRDACRKFFGSSTDLELALRKMRVQEVIAQWVSHWIKDQKV